MSQIVFFLARFSKTGVPLAQMRLAQALYRRGFSVDFVVGFLPSDMSVPEVDGVRVLILNHSRTRDMLSYIYRYLKDEKPEIVFTAEDHLNTIVAAAAIFSRSNAKISASSRITPSRVYSSGRGLGGRFQGFLHRVTRRRLNVLACVSKDMAKQYREMFGGDRYQEVYNIVVDGLSEGRMREAMDDDWFLRRSVPMIIAAGTLTKRKGFHDLINAVSIVRKTRPVRLAILGDGYQRPILDALIQELGLNDSVRLCGLVDNPLKYFACSDVFVLSSYAEGLPNVLVEAMMAGCTPVATDCPTGPAEVLQNDKYGYLVPMHDPDAMASAILKAIDQPVDRELLQEAIAPFREDVVVASHRRLLGF